MIRGLWECSFSHQATLEAVDSSMFIRLTFHTQVQLMAFLPGGQSTKVQVWLLSNSKFFSHYSIQVTEFLLMKIVEPHPHLSRVFMTVAGSRSSWSWSFLASVRFAVDLFSLGPWVELRESPSLACVGSKELQWYGSYSRQRLWIRFSSKDRIFQSKISTVMLHKQLWFVGLELSLLPTG